MPLLAISVLVSLLWGCGCDSHAASGVNYYRFDPTQGILETTVGGQLFASLEIEGQTQSFLPSGGLFPGGACYSFTSDSQGLRKQVVRVQDLRTGQFSRPGVVEQGVNLG
ncbi:MAG: hypothetical protein HY319_16165, partial [Armatimonadetes bacterium]|nr:hypothetical protein [Armatimonadota bacterium]